VDLIFDHRHFAEPPWVVTKQSLSQIDSHFWDWIFWLAGKQLKGESVLVQEELSSMHEHLLAPLGVTDAPGTIAQAVDAYMLGRSGAEERLSVAGSRTLDKAFLPVLTENGLLAEL
jgi:hypothetical protein